MASYRCTACGAEMTSSTPRFGTRATGYRHSLEASCHRPAAVAVPASRPVDPRLDAYVREHLSDHYSEPERLTEYELEYEREGRR